MKQDTLKLQIIKSLSCVRLKDWILILFMIILMVQITYNLFQHELLGNSSPIDNVIRSTTAGLLGYFMGDGFSRRKDENPNNTLNSPENSSKETPSTYNPDFHHSSKTSNIQVLVIGFFGIISLLILIITRNMHVLTAENIATISQLRDFVLGCTGFLVSTSQK